MSGWEIATRVFLGGWAIYMSFCLVDLLFAARIRRHLPWW